MSNSSSRIETSAGHWAASLCRDVESFFFRPRTAHTLALIRICTGSMIAYIHVVWMLRLSSFMGPNALIDNDVWQSLHANTWKWTYLAHTESMSLIWAHEIVACVAGVLMALGLASRLTIPIAWFLTLMTTHRLTGFMFGLDQITIMLALYLIVSRAGNVWSVDAWMTNHKLLGDPSRSSGLRSIGSALMNWGDDGRPGWTNTLSTRLIQLHLCVIYFFGGVGKLRGSLWWDGSAMWFSVSAYEYQSFDMTWIGHFPWIASIATHVALFWEVMYCAIIWPRYTRPIALSIALLVHGGIALFLGMVTFGWMMIVANFAFIEPEWVLSWLSRLRYLKSSSNSSPVSVTK